MDSAVFDHKIKSHLLKTGRSYKKIMKKVGDMNIYTNHQNICYKNISAMECYALNKLCKNLKKIIKPADKGSATVILSRENYIREAH